MQRHGREAAGSDQQRTRSNIRHPDRDVLDKNRPNTGVAESGTVEEIDQFVAAAKPTMLYFSRRPIDPNSINLTQQKASEFQVGHLQERAHRRFHWPRRSAANSYSRFTQPGS
jgi:hypothetical protein